MMRSHSPGCLDADNLADALLDGFPVHIDCFSLGGRGEPPQIDGARRTDRDDARYVRRK
jgi:hypothetical protein